LILKSVSFSLTRSAVVRVITEKRKEAPNPEVQERPKRRRLTAEYKLQILREADACTETGEIGALLRREGLYASQLTEWRRLRDQAMLGSGKRGRKPSPHERRIAELEHENKKLSHRLKQAELIISVQKKVSEILKSPTEADPIAGDD
jgi:transposase-like protein